MFTSGLVIDIKALWGFFKVHFKWAVLIGKLKLRILLRIQSGVLNGIFKDKVFIADQRQNY